MILLSSAPTGQQGHFASGENGANKALGSDVAHAADELRPLPSGGAPPAELPVPAQSARPERLDIAGASDMQQRGSTEAGQSTPALARNNHDQKLPISMRRDSRSVVGRGQNDLGRARHVRSDDQIQHWEMFCCQFAVFARQPIAAPTVGWGRRQPPGLRTQARQEQSNPPTIRRFAIASSAFMNEDIVEHLERRLGRLHARQRIGIEDDHEARVFGQGLNYFHPENWYYSPAIIRNALKLTGLYWRARKNTERIQIRHYDIVLPELPSAFDGFTILQISDLHVDMNEGRCSA